jgi:hypothetical protein
MVLLDLNFSPPVDEQDEEQMDDQDEVIPDEDMVAEVDATGTVLSVICMSEIFPYKDPSSVTAS